MSWLLLILAIGGDVVGTVALDRVADSRRRRAAVACFVLAAAAYLVVTRGSGGDVFRADGDPAQGLARRRSHGGDYRRRG
jgi:hypothetical protein